ncbi:MAG: MFS transporter [Anaerolineae bacterium]|nr:MFS transporter [Anaerolineae bacterium]
MRKREHVTMNVYWFGLSFMWNALHPIILPALLLNFVPESLKNTYLGGMTFVGLILAMIVQPIAGGLSDNTQSQWGRRRPWMLIGTLLSLACLAGMALADNFLWLLIAYVLLQTASNGAHGPAQGLIPDLVPEKQRGLASGIKNLFDMLGLVAASLIAGNLMSNDNPVLLFAVIGATLAISASVTLLTTTESSDRQEETIADETKPSLRNLRHLLNVGLRNHPDYVWLIASRFLILLGIYAVQTFVQYYIRDVLLVPNPTEVTGNLLAMIGLPLTLLVFPAGLLSDRLGRRRLNLLAGAVMAPAIFLLLFARSVTTLLIFGGMIGAGAGIFLSANWALATDLIPQEEAGKYLGLTNLATAGSGAIGRLAGPLIDGVNALRPGAYLGYPTLFILASLSVLAGTLLVLRIRKPTPPINPHD